MLRSVPALYHPLLFSAVESQVDATVAGHLRFGRVLSFSEGTAGVDRVVTHSSACVGPFNYGEIVHPNSPLAGV